MGETIVKIMMACWEILLESSLFILFGFFVAGLLKAFIPDDFIRRHLGRGKRSGVLKASLFGVPIPLCSCGVIPAAAGLRAQGAGKGAIASFMISTPETGVDSIAVTWALLDPVMTVIRPVAAFMTALITGMGVNLLDRDKSPGPLEMPFPMAATCSDGCGCTGGEHRSPGLWKKLRQGVGFAFGDLLGDIGPWLLVGIGLAGVITVYVSPRFIEAHLGGGIYAMLIMLALSTPLYVCATASTPIAAALALKGLSPGAALVFLLAGPATNVATLTVVARLLGKRVAAVYLSAIVACSLGLGLVVNAIYGVLGIDITSWVQSQGYGHHGMVAVVSAVVLLVFIIKPLVQRLLTSASCKGCFHG